MKVVTFGEIMLRLGAPDYLRLNQCNQFDISFAGAEANVAVSWQTMGLRLSISPDFLSIRLLTSVSVNCYLIGWM